MKMKTAWMRQFLICLFVAYTYGAIPTLMRCSPAGIKGEACNMTCTTQDFLQTIEIKRNGSSRGSCTSAFGCTANMYQVGPTETYLQIPILSYTNDIGDWTCTYGSFTSTPPLSFTVYTEPTVTAFINGSSTAPSLGTKFDNVTLSARSYCYFPLVNTAELQYSTSGSVQTLATIPVDPIPASLSSVACDTHEFELQTNVTVDINVEKYKALSGAKDVYFQIIFTSNLGNQFSTGFQLGPYDFEGDTTTPTLETTTEMKTISSSTDSTNGATSDSAETSENTVTKLSTISTRTTTEPSGLSEELRNIIIIVSSVGGSVVIVVIIVIVLCCKRKRNGNNTRKKHQKKDLKKKEFKPDLNYNHQNAKNTQSKPAQAQYNYRKNEKASNEVHKLDMYNYISPYDLEYDGRDIPYSHGRSNLHYGPGYGGRKILYSDGRHNQHYDPYYRKHYTQEMPHSMPYSGYGYPVQYNIPRQDGRQYTRQQPHHGHIERYGPFDQSGHVDKYGPVDQSGYTRRQYDDNWDILF